MSGIYNTCEHYVCTVTDIQPGQDFHRPATTKPGRFAPKTTAFEACGVEHICLQNQS